MDANVVPTLRDAIQEIVALCIHGAPRDTEANEWFDMTQGKFKLLPRIQAYNGTPDHEYLGILIKLRDDLDDHSLNALQLVTKLITDQVALMRFKDADLEVDSAAHCMPSAKHCFLAPSVSNQPSQPFGRTLCWPS